MAPYHPWDELLKKEEPTEKQLNTKRMAVIADFCAAVHAVGGDPQGVLMNPRKDGVDALLETMARNGITFTTK